VSRFTDYTSAASSGVVRLAPWRLELLDSAETVLATTDPADVGPALLWRPQVDPLSFTNDRSSQRSLSFSLPISSGLESLMPGSQGSPLDPSTRHRVRVSAGIYGPSGAVYWPRGTMLVDQVEATYNGGVTTLDVDLVDMIRPLRSELSLGFSFDDGDPVEDVVERIMSDVFAASEFDIAPTGFEMPGGSFAAGENREALVTALLEGCGHELAVSPLGRVYSRPVPPSSGDDHAERWSYGVGGLPVSSCKRVWSLRAPQGFKVEGGSFQTADVSLSVLVWDTDPRSEGFYSGPGEISLPSRQYPFIGTHQQAIVAGYAQLRRHGTGPALVEFVTSPNPAIQVQDLVELSVPQLKVDGLFRVLGSTLPEAGGEMTVVARGVYNPAAGYASAGVDGSPGCLVSFSDNFDRDDQNLEDLAGSPGSPDWTEFGYSWGVVDGRAVQRFHNGWSMAVLNKPLCASDHEMGCEIDAVPAGRFVGPMVRGSGEFDGYVALTDANGRITLELWQAGHRVTTLGSHNSGGSVTGKTLWVRADGSTVIVLLNSDAVISVTDDRGVGRHVGMLGWGGFGAQAPAVAGVTAQAV